MTSLQAPQPGDDAAASSLHLCIYGIDLLHDSAYTYRLIDISCLKILKNQMGLNSHL